MPLVMNCLNRENQVTVGGNTFTFAPKQIKDIYNPDIAQLIAIHRQHLGFAPLPEELTYLTHKRPGKPDPTPDAEHVEIINEARKEGINAYVESLRRIIYNEQVSLKMDMEKAGIKADPRLFMAPQTVKIMEELAQYQTSKDDEAQKRLDYIKSLEKKI